MLKRKNQNSYTKEFKIFIVQERIEKGKTIPAISKEHNVPFFTIKSWIKIYNKSGMEGLYKPKNGTKFMKYDGIFKMEMVELMLSGKLSSYEISEIYGINSGNVRQWKKIFLEKGAQAFYGEKRGRKKSMIQKLKTNKNTDKSEIKKLEDEIKNLKMENEYLKKLNALVHEKEKSQKRIK